MKYNLNKIIRFEKDNEGINFLRFFSFNIYWVRFFNDSPERFEKIFCFQKFDFTEKLVFVFAFFNTRCILIEYEVAQAKS